MKQVLLAVNGNRPSRKAFRYAVGLSKRIRAELSILRFIDKDKLFAYIQTTRKKAVHLGRFLENSFADIAFAEEGIPATDAGRVLADISDPFNDLLADDRPDIKLKLTVCDGDPETNLGRFVESHHDVVLTILDSSRRAGPPAKEKARLEKLKKRLGIPLVIVHSGAK